MEVKYIRVSEYKAVLFLSSLCPGIIISIVDPGMVSAIGFGSVTCIPLALLRLLFVFPDASAVGPGNVFNSGLGIIFTSGSGIVCTIGPGFHYRVFLFHQIFVDAICFVMRSLNFIVFCSDPL